MRTIYNLQNKMSSLNSIVFPIFLKLHSFLRIDAHRHECKHIHQLIRCVLTSGAILYKNKQ